MRSAIILSIELKNSSRMLVLLYIMRHILALPSLLFYMEFGYQSLYYIPKVLYGIHVWRIPRPFQNRYYFIFQECSSTLRAMAWREIMHTDIALLLEHSAITCHLDTMNNITLVFCIIHVTIHCSQSFSLLQIAPQTCTLTGGFTVI